MNFGDEAPGLNDDPVQFYKEKFEKERRRRGELEEECDILSVELLRLQSEITALKSHSPKEVTINDAANESNENQQNKLGSTTTITESADVSDLNIDGDSLYANTPLQTITDACNGKNVVSINFANSDTCIICAGADNSVQVYGLDNLKDYYWTGNLSAPSTSFHSHGPHTACSLFNGSTVLLTFSTNLFCQSSIDELALVSVAPKMLILKDHTKQNSSVQWSPDGSLLASASTDRTVILYRITLNSFDESPSIETISSFRFETTPEAIVFAPANVSSTGLLSTTEVTTATSLFPSSQPFELIVGLRDDCQLRFINCSDPRYSQRLVTLNENEWDTHVSFTPLVISLSPNNKYTLVATDKNYHILYLTGTSKRVRLFSEHVSNSYGRPRICWDPTGKYIFSNTEYEYSIYVYSVVTERVVAKLLGHIASVRGLACRTSDRLLISGSFDKSVRVWKRQLDGKINSDLRTGDDQKLSHAMEIIER